MIKKEANMEQKKWVLPSIVGVILTTLILINLNSITGLSVIDQEKERLTNFFNSAIDFVTTNQYTILIVVGIIAGIIILAILIKIIFRHKLKKRRKKMFPENELIKKAERSVKEARKKGISDRKIKKALRAHGWPEEYINRLLY